MRKDGWEVGDLLKWVILEGVFFYRGDIGDWKFGDGKWNEMWDSGGDEMMMCGM